MNFDNSQIKETITTNKSIIEDQSHKLAINQNPIGIIDKEAEENNRKLIEIFSEHKGLAHEIIRLFKGENSQMVSLTINRSGIFTGVDRKTELWRRRLIEIFSKHCELGDLIIKLYDELGNLDDVLVTLKMHYPDLD